MKLHNRQIAVREISSGCTRNASGTDNLSRVKLVPWIPSAVKERKVSRLIGEQIVALVIKRINREEREKGTETRRLVK